MRSRTLGAAPNAALVAVVLCAVLSGTAWSRVNRTWSAAVSGSADDPNRWSPAGVPAWDDVLWMNAPGTFTVTFPAGVPQSGHLNLATNVTLQMTSPHTTAGMYVYPNGAALAQLTQGSLATSYLHMGAAGHWSRLTLTNAGPGTNGAVLQSSASGSLYGPGDHVGYDGICELNVFGGARYLTESLEMATLATASSVVNVAGFSQNPLRVYSGIQVTNDVVVGVAGDAGLYIYNGGFVNAGRDVHVGPHAGAQGALTVGPVGTFGTATLSVAGNLTLGNSADAAEAGRGEMFVL